MFEITDVQEKMMTFDDFLDFEEKSEVKHEFYNGKLTVMAGGTFDHNHISGLIITLLNLALLEKEGDHFVLTSDMKIYMPTLNRSVYPDAAVVIGEPQFRDKKQRSITNPSLIVEVLSQSTEKKDRTEKFDGYRTLPSLREYVLVSQDEPLVEAYYLADPENDLWKISRANGLDASIRLESIDGVLALKDVYRRVKFGKQT
ncbi:MAG: Uma2 family endonuclease [Bacteroidetes bacterium]|nr:Uma2 family endonuclease [Bacteroidota bacterium]